MNELNSVIIVDDDEVLLGMLKEGFSKEGYRCETASNGEAALDLVSRTDFDIMLTDIVLPGIKGIELAEKAKRLRPEMVVIIMTGFIDDFSYDKAIEAGASDLIKKPFTLKELMVRIRHVKLQEKLRVLSITDELTGLYNRRGFFALAEQQLKLSNRLKKGVFMLYADLDNLKGINDTLGHQEGDLVLVDTANILKESFRESDIIARIGGDEFVVLPIGTGGDSIEAVTSRLQKNIDSYNMKRNRTYRLSLSFGVPYYDPENPCSIDELLAQGDRMMYEQKKIKRGLDSNQSSR